MGHKKIQSGEKNHHLPNHPC